MKKFFGIFVLFVAFVITSCGVNDVHQNASVEFSIPVADIITLRDETGAIDNHNHEYIWKLLVQIKGSKGYFAAKIKTFTDYNEPDLSFSFDALSTDQTYDILVDVFEEMKSSDEELSKAMLLCSTEEKNISISGGTTTPVLISPERLNADNYSLFDVKIDYKDGSSQKSQTIKINSMYLDGDNPCEPKFYIAYSPDDGKYYYSSTEPTTVREGSRNCINQLHSNWKEITDLSYLLKDGSHFDGFDFTAVTYEYDATGAGPSTEKKIPLAFSDGVQSVKTYMRESMVFNYPISVAKTIGDIELSFSTWLPQLSFYSIEFDPDEQINQQQEEHEQNDPHGSTSSETAITEEIHGSLLNTSASEEGNSQSVHELTFVKRSSIEDKSRYIYSARLDDILKGKALSEGDSVVFVMRLPSNYTLAFNQFYYELQVSDWERIEDAVLFENNECINCDTYPAQDGYYTFIMPLNFVEDPQDYDEILFFYDLKDQDETALANAPDSQTLPVAGFDYFIFPAETKTFVFGIGQNWDPNTNQTYPYRYEFKLPLKTQAGECTFEGGETVEVTLSGTVMSYYNEDRQLKSQNYSSTDAVFHGEIFDGAQYAVGESFTGSNEYYHPLSNTGDDQIVNVLNLSVREGRFSSGGTYEFQSIQTPCYDREDGEAEPSTHKYQFQCETRCSDPSKLLVIQNFGITTTVTTAP